VDVLLRPSAARTGLLLLGAIGVYRIFRRRDRGDLF